MTRYGLTLTLASVLLFGVALCPTRGETQEAPNGRYTFDFADGPRIYTFGNGADLLAKGVTVAGVSLRCKGFDGGICGKIRGTCSAGGEVNGVRVDMQGPVTLALSTRGSATQVKETLKMSGRASGFGQTVNFTAYGTATALIFDGDRIVNVNMKISVCAQGTCDRDSGYGRLKLYRGQGPWILRPKLKTKSNGRIRGSATARLFKATFQYKAKGKYDAATGISRVIFTARQNKRCNKIQLTDVRTSGGAMAAGINYKLFGQKRTRVPVRTPSSVGAAMLEQRAPVPDDTEFDMATQEELEPLDAISLELIRGILRSVPRN